MTHPSRTPGRPSPAEAATPAEADRAHPGDDAFERALAHDVHPTPGRRRLLEEHLMREITGDPAQAARAPRPARVRRRPFRLVAPLGATGAVLAIVAGIVLLDTPDPGSAGHTSATPGRVDSAARPTIPRPGQFLYTELELSSWTDSDDVPQRVPPHSRKQWVSQDGRRMVIDEPGAGLNGVSLVNDPPMRWNYLELAALAPDPDVLTATIRQRNEETPGEIEQAVFEEIAGILTRGVVPPGMSNALFEAASRLTGVDRAEDAVDARGRHGIGLARTDQRGGMRTELVFDPNGRVLLGSRLVLTRPRENHPIGAVMATTTVLERDIIDTMPGEPTAGTHGSHGLSIAPTPRS
ncbi:hypothetical protein B4N89_39140 [Embleya scabrispora]|uniref:CU044_5270 family protein n=1 Tax=Embleya scabrispora TaxID=159449 RepID=A0A1T3NN11_9ACTN|nr:CU044_5270 family protein [Embleya scabrispora]OPC78204.1 hypothetical protein B4N89_39140 [Embleya scabrispora]